MLRSVLPRLLPCLSLVRLPALALLMGTGLAACETKTLHPAHGLRFREMQSAQMAARGAHEPVARGEESARAVQLYYNSKFPAGLGGGGGGGTPMAAPMTNSTAGVPPLH